MMATGLLGVHGHRVQLHVVLVLKVEQERVLIRCLAFRKQVVKMEQIVLFQTIKNLLAVFRPSVKATKLFFKNNYFLNLFITTNFKLYKILSDNCSMLLNYYQTLIYYQFRIF
jgi:hypothetical protein